MATTPGKPTNGKPRKRRDPARDRSHLRHTLAVGSLPRDSLHCENRTNALRRELEDLVLERRGSITLSDAAAINSACRLERHCLLALRLMRQAHPMPAETALAFSREIARASGERDKCIAKLDLDGADPLAGLPMPEGTE